MKHNKSMKHKSVTLGAVSAALVAGLAMSIGSAHAAVDQAAINAVTAKIAACARLPLSERGICKAEAVAAYDQFAPKPPMLSSERAALADAQSRYQTALAACGRLPLSERGICKTQAWSTSSRLPGARPAMSVTERVAMDREMQRYQAARAACARLPRSERGICKSEAAAA